MHLSLDTGDSALSVFSAHHTADIFFGLSQTLC